MALTQSQLTTLKTYIQSVPELAALPNNNDGNIAIADAMNVQASPAFYVWRTSVNRREAQAEGFDWTQADNLTSGQARIWEWIFDASGVFNPSEAGVRSGISECWKGTAAKVAVATFVLNQCKRTATIAEKVLSTGTGTQAVPATMTHEGRLNPDDIERARLLP